MIVDSYSLVYESFVHGQQSVQVDIYPFKMTNEHLDTYSEWPQYTFWKNLKKGYDIFERTHVPANVTVVNKNYLFR